MVSIDEVRQVLDQLVTDDASQRRNLMKRLESWNEDGLPLGSAKLILQAATRDFPALSSYPNRPNESLIRLLWKTNTLVSPGDIGPAYHAIDRQYRASALRLLAELKSREASETLAQLLSHAATDSPFVHASWPVLAPIERDPRDPDLLVGPLLRLCSTRTGLQQASSVLLGYAIAGALDSESQLACAQVFAPLARELLSTFSKRHAQADLLGQVDSDQKGDLDQAGLYIDLLARLDAPEVLGCLRAAAIHVEPHFALWGAIGLLRRGEEVASDILESLAADRAHRKQLAELLDDIGKLDLFPRRYWNQACLAEADMVKWLMFPTELDHAPEEILQLAVIPVDTDDGLSDLYVFKFRTHPPHWANGNDWMVGIAGPYPRSEQPMTHGYGTCSHMNRLESMTIDEHIQALVDWVENIESSG